MFVSHVTYLTHAKCIAEITVLTVRIIKFVLENVWNIEYILDVFHARKFLDESFTKQVSSQGLTTWLAKMAIRERAKWMMTAR